MIPNRHSRRFDPRWLFPFIGADGAELLGAPEASARSTAGESGYDSAGMPSDEALEEFDEALEQIVIEGWRFWPLRGSVMVRSDPSFR